MNQRVGFESFAEAAELLALAETRQPRVQSAQARQSPLTNVHVEVRGGWQGLYQWQSAC